MGPVSCLRKPTAFHVLLTGEFRDSVEYAYDHMGQRILRRGHDGVRTRYFFAGLTEEIVKTAVPGVQDDDAFALDVAIEGGDDTAWNHGVGSGGIISSVYDEERRKDVTHFHHASNCNNRFDATTSTNPKRVISLWHRRDVDCGRVVIHTATSEGTARVNYRFGAGTDFVDQSGSVWDYNIYLDLPPGEWVRIEQDIAADILRLTPTALYQNSLGVWLWGRDFRIGDVRFSNSMTTERNSLLPGSIGQVAYRERWEGTGGSPTPTYGGSARGGGQRRWNSYNHIGNVVGTSNASGYFVEAVNTDAFGNPLASTQTGEWAGGLGGNRGLTTKEFDPAAGMYYFYQRWYDPQTATFASRAPMSPMVEHPYGFAGSSPLVLSDPAGRLPQPEKLPGALVSVPEDMRELLLRTLPTGTDINSCWNAIEAHFKSLREIEKARCNFLYWARRCQSALADPSRGGASRYIDLSRLGRLFGRRPPAQASSPVECDQADEARRNLQSVRGAGIKSQANVVKSCGISPFTPSWREIFRRWYRYRP